MCHYRAEDRADRCVALFTRSYLAFGSFFQDFLFQNLIFDAFVTKLLHALLRTCSGLSSELLGFEPSDWTFTRINTAPGSNGLGESTPLFWKKKRLSWESWK